MMIKDDRLPHILVVDDEPLVRNLLKDLLSDNYVCTTAESAEAALSKSKKNSFNLTSIWATRAASS